MYMLLLNLLSSLIVLTSADCPEGTVLMPSGNSCLLKSLLPVNISSAQGACTYAGGNLISIHDDATNVYLTTQLTESPIWTIGAYVDFVDVDSPNNTWRWYDNSSFDYNNFWKYQNFGEYTAQFGMGADGHANGIWVFGTKSDAIPFVCNIPQPVLPPPAGKQCPDSSKFIGAMNRCLIPVLKVAGFDEAEQNCKSVGGHLPAILDAFQNSAYVYFVENYMTNMTGDRVFIGLDNYNQKWTFTDGNTPANYTNWETPDEAKRVDAYALLSLKSQRWSSLSKLSDLILALPYVCAFVPWS